VRPLRLGKEKNQKEEENRNHSCKIKCPHLLRRAAINKPQQQNIMACPQVRGHKERRKKKPRE